MKKYLMITIAIVLVFGAIAVSALILNNSNVDPPTEELDHTCSYDVFISSTVTCLSAGSEIYACHCGLYQITDLPASGHNFAENICSNCGVNRFFVSWSDTAYDGVSVSAGSFEYHFNSNTVWYDFCSENDLFSVDNDYVVYDIPSTDLVGVIVDSNGKYVKSSEQLRIEEYTIEIFGASGSGFSRPVVWARYHIDGVNVGGYDIPNRSDHTVRAFENYGKTAPDGKKFSHWFGSDGNIYFEGDIVNISGDFDLTAIFIYLHEYVLRFSVSVEGSDNTSDYIDSISHMDESLEYSTYFVVNKYHDFTINLNVPFSSSIFNYYLTPESGLSFDYVENEGKVSIVISDIYSNSVFDMFFYYTDLPDDDLINFFTPLGGVRQCKKGTLFQDYIQEDSICNLFVDDLNYVYEFSLRSFYPIYYEGKRVKGTDVILGDAQYTSQLELDQEFSVFYVNDESIGFKNGSCFNDLIASDSRFFIFDNHVYFDQNLMLKLHYENRSLYGDTFIPADTYLMARAVLYYYDTDGNFVGGFTYNVGSKVVPTFFTRFYENYSDIVYFTDQFGNVFYPGDSFILDRSYFLTPHYS